MKLKRSPTASAWISKGELILVEDKVELMRKLGKKQLTLQLQQPLQSLPEQLRHLPLELRSDGNELNYTYDAKEDGHNRIPELLNTLGAAGIGYKDLKTTPKLARRHLRAPRAGPPDHHCIGHPR